jgi:hypothetical protein
MKNYFKFLVLLMALISLNSCEELFDDGEDSSSASSSGNCTPYAGPTGDIQSDAFCKAAWNYRCAGKKVEADANCKIYKSLKVDNPKLPNCPYCP